MSSRSYTHSAYWYAYHYGYTHSDAKTLTGQYLDLHTYRPRMRERADGEFRGKDWLAWRKAGKVPDSTFNPLLFGVCIAMDIGVAMRDTVRRIADPEERTRMAAELRRELRIVRRPFYYARETARRRALAIERRKITRRRTTSPMPTPEGILAAWNARKESKEAMIRLGGMLHDLACYVDSSLRFDGFGNVVGRNGGIRGWLDEHLPELSPKYKTLMRYKALAIKLRQATGTEDPVPTEKLLDEPQKEEVRELLEDFRMTFSSIEEGVVALVDPKAVFAERLPEKDRLRGRNQSSEEERSQKKVRLPGKGRLSEKKRLAEKGCRLEKTRRPRRRTGKRHTGGEERRTDG